METSQLQAVTFMQLTVMGQQITSRYRQEAGGRRAKSLFRLGLDDLSHLVLSPSASCESDFRQSLQLLSCT